MRLYLLLLLITTGRVYSQTGCNPDNLVNSDEDPKFLSISVDGQEPPGVTDIYKPKGVFLVSNNVVTIKSSLGSDILMQVTKFKAEFFKVNFAQLVMKDSANNILYDESRATEETWTEVEWNLGDGIIDVASIELSFKAPAAELRVRNLFLEVCILIGWCPWSAWNKCSVTCGGGDQSSSRTCTCPNPDPDRFKCPPGPSERTQECNTDCCKKPPSWDPWKQWDDCTVSCGGGERSRTRKCIDDPCPDETDCPGKNKQTEDCNTDCCKQPPSWGPWTAWSKCSVTCATGSQERSRECIPHPCDDGSDCIGNEMETKICKKDCCPVAPGWGPWTPWGDCSVTCEDGTQKRKRECIEDECHDNTDCEGKSSQTQPCTEPCCPQPPKWTKWSDWSECSVTCEDGIQERYRECVEDPCPDNTKCPGSAFETQVCKEKCCPQPPSWGAWKKWGACSVTCEIGSRSRKRKCKQAECPDYTKCPGDKIDTESCDEGCCPQPPNWSEWGYWGECTVTCGGGTQERERTCVDDECPDYTKCPGKSTMTQKCNEDCCPIPPEWTKWGQWSECSATCGQSERERERKCKESDCPGDYKDCPGPSTEKEECDKPCCRIIINWNTRKLARVMLRNIKNNETSIVPKDKPAPKVLKKSGKSIFLVDNFDVTQYLDVTLKQEYQILKIEVETILADYVTVTLSPTGLPPGQGVSSIDEDQLGPSKWNQHKFNFGEPGIGPVGNIRLDFGFNSGEIRARNLEITACPPEDNY